MGFSTDAIHVGQEPDPLTGSVVAPIYQTSTYVMEKLGKSKGYDYARTTHPNRMALERTVAKLECGQQAYVFTSGMAAIDAVFRLLRPGDHTIISKAVYGGTFRLTTKLLVEFGGFNLSHQLALVDVGPDIHIPALQIAAGPRVDWRIVERLHVPRQIDFLNLLAALRIGDAHGGNRRLHGDRSKRRFRGHP